MEFSPIPSPSQKRPSSWRALLFSAFISSMATLVVSYFLFIDQGIISPLGKSIGALLEEDKPLEKYSFRNLSEKPLPKSSIKKETIIEEKAGFTAYLFSVEVEGQRVTGQLNIPKTTAPQNGYPVIIMNRGFIDPAVYQTGMGTKNAAGYYASNGFVTIAPDFLGFGGSDAEDIDPMAARVKKIMVPLTIINSLESMREFTPVDTAKIFMWGHSNGGQISLSVLEVLGQSQSWNQVIPTTLWAPVTAAFPYNILYYTDDFDQVGKSLRQVLYNFELKYDTHEYSIHSFIDWIDSPILVHQGTNDELIPTEWSNRITRILEEKQKDVTYFKYEGADHNLLPNWSQVVERDVKFFQNYMYDL